MNENISEQVRVSGFSDMEQVPSIDAQNIIDTILGTDTE